MSKNLKSKCCKSYKEGKPCKDCPKVEQLGKKKAKKLFDKYR